MSTTMIRHFAVTAAAVASVAGAMAGGPVEQAAAVPAAVGTGIVPPAGSATAFGYSAVIRHVSGEQDNQGTLVLVAPDGRSSSIGAVSDTAWIHDVSSNARTVVTGLRTDSGELRLAIWDTESKKPTYLRVAGGDDAQLVRDGVLVTRSGKATQLYSRSGALVRTYTGAGATGYASVSADGTRFMAGDTSGRVVVRTVSTRAVQRIVPVPAGRSHCYPGAQFDANSFSMDCAEPGGGAPESLHAYRAGFASTVPTTALVPRAAQSSQVRRTNNTLVFNSGGGAPCGQPAWTDAAGTWSYLRVGNDAYPSLAGAHGTSAYLLSDDGCTDRPTHQLVRQSSSGVQTVLAGPGSSVGGRITDAKTMDGS